MDFVDHAPYEPLNYAADDQKLTFKLISGQGELFAIAPQWQELVDASARPRPMNSPAWLLQWLRHYGADVELAVGVLCAGTRLVGLAPLCLRNHVYRVGLVFRRLQFLGVDGDERDGVGSAYSGFVARQGFETLVAREFVRRVRENEFGAWHEIVIGSIDTEAATSVAMLEAIDELGLHRAGSAREYACIRLPRTWDAYLGTLTAQQRCAIEDALRRFEDWVGRRDWQIGRADTPDAAKQTFDRIVALNADASSDCAIASPRFQAFHRDYISAQASLRGVDLAVLMVAQETIAATYSLRSGRRLISYQTASSVHVPSDIRAGLVIQALMIKDAIERGDDEFDFLGNQIADELSSTANQHMLTTLRVSRPCAREAIRTGLSNLAGSVRAWLSGDKGIAPIDPIAIGIPAPADPR